MAKTSLQTKGKNEANYVKFVENVIVKLTENSALFTDLDPTIVEIEGALSSFKKAQADAAFRDMRFVVIKNQELAVLKRMVYDLWLYVEKVAKGDPSVIMAAGFVPVKSGSPVGESPKPQNLRAEVNVNVPGMTTLKVNAWKRALVYQFEYRKRGEGNPWETVLSSKAKITISNLESMSFYDFRVAYIGRDSLVTYSDTVSAAIL